MRLLLYDFLSKDFKGMHPFEFLTCTFRLCLMNPFDSNSLLENFGLDNKADKLGQQIRE